MSLETVIAKSAELMGSVTSEAAAAVTPGVIPPMPPEMIAAAIGAFLAGGIIILFEIVKQHRAKKALRKALKISLYYEILDNIIIENKTEEDAPLQFSMPNFCDSSYQKNKTDIARLFDEQLFIDVSRYYSLVSQANAYHTETIERLIQIEANSKDMTQDEKIYYYNSRQGMENIVSKILLSALGFQEAILPELKKAFTIDPDKTKVLIPEKYKERHEKQREKKE